MASMASLPNALRPLDIIFGSREFGAPKQFSKFHVSAIARTPVFANCSRRSKLPFTIRPSSTVSTPEIRPCSLFFITSSKQYAWRITSLWAAKESFIRLTAFENNSSSGGISGRPAFNRFSRSCGVSISGRGGKNTAKNWHSTFASAILLMSSMASGMSYMSFTPFPKPWSNVSQCISAYW